MSPDPLLAKTKSGQRKIREALAGSLRVLIEPGAHIAEQDQRQVRLLSSILLAMILSILLTIPLILTFPRSRNIDVFLLSIILELVLLLAYGSTRTKYYKIAGPLTISATAVGVWAIASTDASYPNAVLFDLSFVVISVILSSLLVSVRITCWLSVLHVAGILLLPAFRNDLKGSPQWETLLIFVIVMSALTILVASRRQLDQEEISSRSQALAASEAQLQSILDNSTAIIYLKDSQGRYILVNRQFESVYRMNRDQVIGKTAADLFPPEAADANWAHDQTVLQTGESLEVEETAATREGTFTYITVKFPLHNAQGNVTGIGSLSTDITGRKRVEEALLQSEERFRLVSYATNDVVWDWDLMTNHRWWNQSLRRLFGFATDQMNPDNSWWEEQLHPEDREKVVKSIQNAIDAGEEFWSKEYRLRRADGSYASVFDRGYILRNESGKPVRMLGAIMDISVRKSADEALAQEQYLLNVLLDNVPDSIYFKDTRSRYTRVGKALAAVHGLEPEQMVGTSDFDYFTKDYAQATYEMEQRIIRTAQPLINIETCEFWPDRSPTWASVIKMPLRDKDGKIIGTFGISRDITGRKLTEDALKEANEKQTIYISELEQYTREAALLNEMSDLLQTCPTLEEAYKVTAEISSQLFDQDAGILYTINSSKNLVERVASWGPPLPDSSAFEPNDCWGLRLGRLHVMDKGREKNGHSGESLALLCNHIHAPGPEAYICVPLVAQGEALGLLHVRHLPDEAGQAPNPEAPGEWFTGSKQQFSRSIAYRVGLALANLRLRETLRQQSIRDPLTGLFNRRYMEESLERELRRVMRNQRPLGIMMMDIDHFKQYNDIHGHEAGDLVLRRLGALLRTNIRAEDIACRYGGEEFVLIMPDASLEVTRKRAEKLCEEVKHLEIVSHEHTLSSVTLSLGVAAYPDHGQTGEAVLKAADESLYRAKRAGRDRVEVAEAFSETAEIPPKPEKKPKNSLRRGRA